MQLEFNLDDQKQQEELRLRNKALYKIINLLEDVQKIATFELHLKKDELIFLEMVFDNVKQRLVKY